MTDPAQAPERPQPDIPPSAGSEPRPTVLPPDGGVPAGQGPIPPAPPSPIAGPSTDLPLALFPVRLETRFIADSSGPQLLVRVYVDDLVVDAHEIGLSDAEITWGQHFWEQAWRAGPHQAAERTAWDQLARLLGSPRATYVAECLQPTNSAQRPANPTPPDQPLSVAPSFSAPPTRPSAWTRAPRTNVMPDRWVALGYIAGQRVFTFQGNSIPDPLIVGLSPDPARGFDAISLAADPDISWLVDFAAAERVGMGLRIPITWPATAKLDRLLVLGTRATLSGPDGEARLEGLLRALRYTQGLAFLKQGTPSNNTPDVASGYTSQDTDFESSPLAEADWPVLRTGDGSNRDVTGQALGIVDSVLAGLREAGTPEQRDAYHMNTAVWKATWGYYLEQLMTGAGGLTDDAIRLGREHFSSYVRGRGPLPAWRVGVQPYGVLPVISLDRWLSREGTPIDAPLVGFLHALRDVWRRSLAHVPCLPGSSDPATDLLRILAMSPTSLDYQAHPAQPVVEWPASPTPPPTTVGSGEARRVAQQLGITWAPRHVRTMFTTYPQASHLSGGLVQPIVPVPGSTLPPHEILSETDPVDRKYVGWLATALLAQIRAETLSPPPATLLYSLLRHAALLEYSAAAYRIRLRQGQVTADARLEPDVVGARSPTPWDLLNQTIAGQDPPVASAYLDTIKASLVAEPDRDLAPSGSIWRRGVYDVSSPQGDRATDMRDFAAFNRSLSYLDTRPSAVLGRLLPETLDLSSHRFDAWATSFATKRLEWLRSQAPKGIYLGGYGFVEDLLPTPRSLAVPPTPAPGEPTPPELAAPLYQSPSNKGFLHAPSLAHATTAAILRSGYLSRQATSDGQALAVNLSSARIRIAQWLLDGVRQGQSLSVLLGYRFERGLHENHPGLILDQYIEAFRRIAPLELPPPTDGQWVPSVQAQPASNVVDGLALLTRYRAAPGSPLALAWGVANLLPAVGTDAYTACLAELQALDDAVDAITDLVTAEAVHHVAAGNTMRAGATLEAIAQGEAPSQEIDVARTPRTGVGITHRLITVLQDGSVPVGWGAPSHRASAEPYLNAWAARLLGPDASAATCTVEYLDPMSSLPVMSQGVPARREITLSDPALLLSPLDVAYLPEASQSGQWSELEQRVAYVALRSPPTTLPANVSLRLTFSRPANAPSRPLRFVEVLEAARAARRLLTSARPLRPNDLATDDATLGPELFDDVPPAGQPATGADHLLRLSDRADTASSAFKVATDALAATVRTSSAGMNLDQVRIQLLDLSGFSIPGAVPLFATGTADPIPSRLAAQAASVVREAGARKQQLLNLEAGAANTTLTPEAARDYHVARLQTIFGSEFRVLPRFHAPDAGNLGNTLGASDALQGGNPLESVTWFQRVSRVRENAALLDTSLLYAEVLGVADALAFRVGQLPVQAGDRWVGLPVRATQAAGADGPPPRPPGGRVSLVIHAPTAFDPNQPATGLLVDEWTEVVPSAEETTGFMFHYDQPQSRAPQAILLAVGPDAGTTWSLDTLEATLLESLELARLRTVDLNALSEVTHYLPAQFLASVSPETTVATNFSRLATS